MLSIYATLCSGVFTVRRAHLTHNTHHIPKLATHLAASITLDSVCHG